MPFIIGLTGGIASGKTTVANLFHEKFGIGIVDADIVAREVVAPGTPGLKKIVNHFGSDIIDADGNLDRSQLRERIFSNPNEKQWLNNLLHPMIRAKMKQDLGIITTPYALLVVPLLVENQLQSMADRILVVDVSQETQLRRTIIRDKVSKEQVQAILASQASREERLASADDVIKNDKDDTNLLSQVEALHTHYLSLSNKT